MGVEKSCSMEPRSYSRAMVSAVSMTAMMTRMRTMRPGTRKMALLRPGLKSVRTRAVSGGLAAPRVWESARWLTLKARALA
jgi:hypothetical protein